MKIPLILGATALAVSTAALAQRPAVYPLRSQTAATQGLDNAYCYWQARRETGVDTVRQSQRPTRTKPLQFAADGGKGASEPPLPAPHAGPASTTSAGKPVSHEAEVSAAASAGAASIPAARSGRGDAGGAGGASAQTAAAPGSAGAASGASPGLPPLPPPEPPMERYWQAYGDCMQGRGYGVQ
ncbi:hypothetical protein AB1286_27065 [Trinickia sp. NRRL B-1857]|uniref:hypothetical protein n=1 Tax=Trinickia sp. NRRL B-1857 TaxID=3162879 RepID=UPI003D2CA37B